MYVVLIMCGAERRRQVETTNGLVRGYARPSTRRGDVLVESHSVRTAWAGARGRLGVCPQFDAVNRLTVRENLAFYARVVAARKLSLGITIINNPSVLPPDKPSSSIDTVAKGVMWRVPGSVKGGRSPVITTHSMEGSSALAGRSGIMARRGEAHARRWDHGRAVLEVRKRVLGAPNSQGGGPDHAGRHLACEATIRRKHPGCVMDGVALHGQLKFVVPKQSRVGWFIANVRGAGRGFDGPNSMTDRKT
ncbi:hypothetical protein F4779DRAFT_634957 [Xylariaceae sp. FL0662B]|nr:hypothetical protein F4779DRAFT_634957 [Xylariaceae sp. FL0662B]